GGYMINWIAGDWPHRLTCLVAHDGNLDERVAYYTTGELWFPEAGDGGVAGGDPRGGGRPHPSDHGQKREKPHPRAHHGQGVPRRRDRRARDVHRPSAEGDPEPPPLLPRREPLGLEAAKQHPLARHRARLARPLDAARRARVARPARSAYKVSARGARWPPL